MMFTAIAFEIQQNTYNEEARFITYRHELQLVTMKRSTTSTLLPLDSTPVVSDHFNAFPPFLI